MFMPQRNIPFKRSFILQKVNDSGRRLSVIAQRHNIIFRQLPGDLRSLHLGCPGSKGAKLGNC